MSLAKKVILVSGATGGLGQTVVQNLIRDKAVVIGLYQRDTSLQKLKKSLPGDSNFDAHKVNLSKADEVERLFDILSKKYDSLDALFHLAGGFWMGGNIVDTPVDKWNEMIETNLNATFLVCRKSFSMMREKGGHILTIAAKPALELTAGMGAYAVSKAGVLALTGILAEEGKEFNIRANCILPGIIDTPGNRNDMPGADFSKWVSAQEISDEIFSLTKSKSVTDSIVKMYGKL